jgi:hypothetical protein
VEGTQGLLLGVVDVLIHILQGRVDAHLWTVVFAGLLGNQEIVVNDISQLLLLIVFLILVVFREVQDANSRRSLLFGGFIEDIGIDLHILVLFISWRKVDLWSSIVGAVLIGRIREI